ncbi:MAG: TlpA family protein disulfide reductase [Nitrospirae bacterium]|nr:TlpA family protein disulfide reductase [Nitrospirota bacterium]
MKKLAGFLGAALVLVSLLSCSRGEKGASLSSNDAAPAFVLSTPEGAKISLDDYKGKVVMIEFFASWCPPCQMVAPEIKSAYERYKDKGFTVLAISIDEGPDAGKAVSNFIKTYGISYPVALDDGTASRRYQVISIPTSFIIDKTGKLANKHIGLIPNFAATLSKEIETLL